MKTTEQQAYEVQRAKQIIREKAEEAEGPEVGEGVTMCHYSDRHAGTVIDRTMKSITVQADKSTNIGTLTDQKWTYERDPEGPTFVFTLRKNVTWRIERSNQKDGTRLIKGRSEHYDPHF